MSCYCCYRAYCTVFTPMLGRGLVLYCTTFLSDYTREGTNNTANKSTVKLLLPEVGQGTTSTAPIGPILWSTVHLALPVEVGEVGQEAF